jgi:hypothetical protein
MARGKAKAKLMLNRLAAMKTWQKHTHEKYRPFLVSIALNFLMLITGALTFFVRWAIWYKILAR